MNLNNQQLIQYNRIINVLKDKNLRLTDIRSETIKAIILLDHPTINDIILELEKEFKNVNIMSVYNTLDLLLNEHILYANVFNNKQICYDILTEKSLHLKCDNCDKVEHIDNNELSKLQLLDIVEIAKEHGMTVDHFKIEAHGICKECTKKLSTK